MQLHLIMNKKTSLLSLSANYYSLPCPHESWIKIVHLDDQQLFRDAFAMMINKHMKNVIIVSFQDCDEAIKYIENSITNGDKISLVVTDYKHPGIDGCEFADLIRIATKDQYHIPVLLLTMMDYYSIPAISIGCRGNIITKYLPKHSSAKKIVTFIKSL